LNDGSVKRIKKKLSLFSLVLTKYILLTETPSRLNFTGFQPGLDRFSNVKLRSPKPKKGEVKAI
jgi:hypothetical protein